MAKPQHVVYFRASVEDKPGALLEVLKDLKAKNLGLVGLWAYGVAGGKTDIYFIAKNPEKVKNTLQASGLLAGEGTGLWIKGADKTGALLKPLEAIAKAGVNIEATHALAFGGKYGSFFRVKPEDVEKASQALGGK